MSILFTPYFLSGLTLKNRVVMAPMTRARAETTVPDDLTVLYYQQRAGAGLIITEGVPVSVQGRGYLFNPGLYTQEQVEGWKRVNAAVHQKQGCIFAQLWHVGRVSHTSLQPNGEAPVSSSAKLAANSNAYAYDENHQPGPIQASKPRALTVPEIADIKGDFVRAACRAMEAGFDGIEIHGDNGYLFEQFINPTVNDRTDEYGGSIQNRIRLLLETIDAVAAAIGREKVGVRISPFGRLFDMAPFEDEAETWVTVAAELQKRNIAYVHLSDQLTIAKSTAPFALVYATMFNPLVGHIVMALAVMACVGSLLGWQFTLAQTAKMTADQNLFLKFFSKVNAMNAPVVGMIVCGVLQTLMALSTISPDAAAQFSKLVNLAAVTNLIPYLTALTGLLVIMYKAGVSTTIYARNLVVLLVAVTYSLYALYACGKDAVMGGTLVLAFGYLLYGFLAKRFTDTLPAEQAGAGNP